MMILTIGRINYMDSSRLMLEFSTMFDGVYFSLTQVSSHVYL
jgi:hypothetical protein